MKGYVVTVSAVAVVASSLALAGPDGHFRATVPLRAGTNVITAAVAHGAHATGWAQVPVKS